MSNLKIFDGAKVLVTGHNGFKGTWLSSWLIKMGANVTGISLEVSTSPSHYQLAFLGKHIDERQINICDLDSVKSIFEEVKPDFVFHLAAQALVRKAYKDPVEAWNTNTLGTVNVLESLRCLDRKCVAIMITSDKCYDNLEWEWGYRETDPLGGPDPYSGSKGAAELAIKSYVKSFLLEDGHIRLGIGRAGNVIGGGDWSEDRIVPDCVRAWASGKEVKIRNPIATRPWQHVLEPLSGYINLAIELNNNSKNHGEAFNFGPADTQNRSVMALVEEMSRYWDQVKWLDTSKENDGPYESGLLKLNCDKALHHLQWKPTWGFEVTVAETTHWYKEYYENKEASIFELTSKQIDSYISYGKLKNLFWAN